MLMNQSRKNDFQTQEMGPSDENMNATLRNLVDEMHS